MREARSWWWATPSGCCGTEAGADYRRSRARRRSGYLSEAEGSELSSDAVLARGDLADVLIHTEAARSASLEVLEERRRRGQDTHPFSWAGFVASEGRR